MKDKAVALAYKIHPARLNPIVSSLLKDEAISGKLILIAVVLALIAVNSPLKSVYDSALGTHLSIGLGSWSLDYDIRHWINDGLMTFFFLVVGLELSRELRNGELRSFKTAALPFVAAIGGMIAPALIFMGFNLGQSTFNGWAIPIATDIALAIGLLALLGKRVPSSLRLFLLTLAIVDDILAVIVIALFYTEIINAAMLGLALVTVIAMLAITKFKYMNMYLFIAMSIVLWLAVNASGVHPTIAGAVVGLIAPLALMRRQRHSIAHTLERATIPVSTLVVVPVFAFANTGIVLTLTDFSNEAAVPLSAGIILGLVIGKSVGIVLATWLMVRGGKFTLPEGSNWTQLTGIGMLAGIGFTVSIFVTELAFDNEQYITIAKMSIFVASALSAMFGLLLLSSALPRLPLRRRAKIKV